MKLEQRNFGLLFQENFIIQSGIRGRGNLIMKKFFFALILSIFFVALGFIILLEQYLNFGMWFQLKDIHHETFALSSFALAIGILIGSNFPKK